MRTIRTLALTSALVLALSAAGLACSVKSAMVSGQFDENGNFQVISALDAKGNDMEKAAGAVFSTITMADDLALPTSTPGKVYLVADLDFENKAMHVASFTQCAKTAEAHVSSVRTAGAGSGCCASKAAASTAASAKVASASSGCSGAKAATASSGCSRTTAATASTKVANASGCSGTKSASSAKTASSCHGSESTKAAAAAAAASDRFIVLNVSGMTCGGCSSKVEAAIAALELDGVVKSVVSFEDGTAIVYITKDVDAEAIVKAVDEAGFPAALAQGEAPEAPAKG